MCAHLGSGRRDVSDIIWFVVWHGLDLIFKSQLSVTQEYILPSLNYCNTVIAIAR